MSVADVKAADFISYLYLKIIPAKLPLATLIMPQPYTLSIKCLVTPFCSPISIAFYEIPTTPLLLLTFILTPLAEIKLLTDFQSAWDVERSKCLVNIIKVPSVCKVWNGQNTTLARSVREQSCLSFRGRSSSCPVTNVLGARFSLIHLYSMNQNLRPD